MRIFAIKSEADISKKELAYLLYYEKERSFYIELPEEADPWETPLLLSSFLKRGEKTINSYWSLMWVRQRIIPSDRQNIGQVLKENGMEEYDEFKLLMSGQGRCAQDDYFLEEVSEDKLLEDFSYRYEKRIEDVVPLKKGYLLVFFRNGKVKKVSIKKIADFDLHMSAIINQETLFNKVMIQPGGYGVYWNERAMIADYALYAYGKEIDLSIEDFCSFVSNRVVGTAEAMELLSCSRQNINDLVKRGKLSPIKTEQKNTLFLKSEILHRNWQ